MLNVTAADASNGIQQTRFAPRAADASGLWLIPMQTRRSTMRPKAKSFGLCAPKPHTLYYLRFLLFKD
ncbi:Uncharacterised protein [uncultured archaeon]|nr:Uncharacterised protein [uncultured archaeon]